MSITLSHPTALPATTITLPNASPGNAEQIDNRFILRQSQDAYVRSYRLGSQKYRLVYNISNMTNTEFDSLVDLITVARNDSVKLIDHNSENWTVKIVSQPINSQIVKSAGCTARTITLEFYGEPLIGGLFRDTDLEPFDADLLSVYKMSEGSGNLLDSHSNRILAKAGSGTDATYELTGKDGAAIKPNDRYFANISGFSYSVPFTLSLWTKRNGLASSGHVFRTTDSVSGHLIGMGVSTGGVADNELWVTANDGSNYFSGTGDIFSDDTWYHLMIIYTTGSIKFYLNNILVHTIPRSPNVSANNKTGLWTGNFSTGGAIVMIGDETCLWNTDLNAAARTALYNSGAGTFYKG